MVEFAEIHNGMHNTVVAYIVTDHGEQILGKHYTVSGLSWTIKDPVRDYMSIGDWKAKVLNEYEGKKK